MADHNSFPDGPTQLDLLKQPRYERTVVLLLTMIKPALTAEAARKALSKAIKRGFYDVCMSI